MNKRIGFWLYQSCGDRRSVGVCLCCCGVGGQWVGSLEQGLKRWGGMYV